MLKNFTSLIFFLIFSELSTKGQTTITLRPDASSGKDAIIDKHPSFINTNLGTNPDFACWAWTNAGTTVARGLIRFDLSSIPSNAIITNAKISFWCNAASSVTQLQSGNNESHLYKITSAWDESTVTWNNQPTIDTSKNIGLTRSTSQTQNYLNIDATNLVSEMHSNPSTNFGFMLKLDDESLYKTMLFASSDCADSLKRPFIEIIYTISNNNCRTRTLFLKPDAFQGKDAIVDSRNTEVNNNFGTSSNLAAWAWTTGGTPTTARSFMNFDISAIPQGATIQDATLSLWCNTTSSVTQLQSGNNESYLQRVTGAWDENTITWNNQPTTSITNRIAIPRSTSQTQNYLNIDVKNLVKDIFSDPLNSFGFMLRLQTESTYRTMLFASSDHQDSALWPALNITYCLPPPTLSIISPNGGEGWNMASNKFITWNSAFLDSVDIYYSIDSGVSWKMIASSYPASYGYFYWNIPFDTSDMCLIKITGTHDSIIDISDSFFRILPPVKTITVLTPNGGEIWAGASTHNITWTSQWVDSVSIHYTLDNGTNWSTITTSTPSTGSYSWQLPDTTSTCIIKVSSINGIVSDLSNNPFSIFKIVKSIQLNSPNGGENWAGASIYNITWTSQWIDSVSIHYSFDNGNIWNILKASYPSTGSYQWHLPDTSANCLIRISSIDGLISDWSDSSFHIYKLIKSVQVTSPNGGENWNVAQTHNITWISQNVDSVSIAYSLNNGNTWQVITASYPSSGTYQWHLPDTSANCLIRISSIDGLISDWSDSLFNIFRIITPAKAIHVTSPNGGENWIKNSTQTITWNSTGIDSVMIQYTSDNGINWNTITASIPSSGSFVWSLPSITSNSYLVKITSNSFQVSDESDSLFSIYSLTGINESNDNVMNVFPNPASSIVTISLTNPFNGQIKIYDLQGRVFKTEAINIKTDYTIDLESAGLKAGIYFIELVNDQNTNRFIKKVILVNP